MYIGVKYTGEAHPVLFSFSNFHFESERKERGQDDHAGILYANIH
jgi:hypothetical protein